ncbi:ABC transporter ATP-binding protein [Candidatus Bipolaricaulota bacterium]|nr:ABC transporter ATP-binding protein [Candidatus Bipolaricaulota bacterium]
MRTSLTFAGVSKSFPSPRGRMVVLDGLSLEVDAGGWTSLVGPSGCGKTTLAKIAAGILTADAGQVLVGGMGVERSRTVAYMPQHDTLLPWRSALENAILSADVDGRSRAQARSEARQLFVRFGLGGFEEQRPSTLSGGMRQRVALIRTFLTRRDILVLDEPFGALDALTRAGLQQWLSKIWMELGHTVLFITHDVEEAVLLSDRVAVCSSLPGRIRTEVQVMLPRPRSRVSAEVTAYRASLLETLAAGAIS